MKRGLVTRDEFHSALKDKFYTNETRHEKSGRVPLDQ
jgi:hypothetical protein